MTLNPLGLSRMFAVSVLCGIALEILWECMGIIGYAFRYRLSGEAVRDKDSPAGLVALFIKDVLFFLIAGIAVIILIYWTNDGQFRMLTPTGVLIGFFACRQTVGILLRKLTEQVVKLIYAALRILFYPLFKFKDLVLSLFKKISRGAEHRRMLRYTQKSIAAVGYIKANGIPKVKEMKD